MPGSTCESGLHDDELTVFAAPICVFEGQKVFAELAFTNKNMICFLAVYPTV